MGIVYKKKEYNTKEEIMELLRNHLSDIKGLIVMVDPETKESKNVDLKDFVMMLGLEEAAEILSMQTTMANEITATMDDLKELLKKKERGETLSDEENKKLYILLSELQNDTHVPAQDQFLHYMAKTINDHSDYLTIGNFVALICATLPNILSGNGDKLKACRDNPNTLFDIGKKIGDDILNTWKSTLKQDVPVEMIAMGLLHALGEVVCKDPNHFYGSRKVDLEFLIDSYCLDKSFIYDECDCEDCKESKKESSITPMDFLDEILENVKEQVVSSEAKSYMDLHQETRKTDPEIVDIRERLKKNRKDQ